MILTKASQQWATRPDDQRFTSLLDMQQFMKDQRELSQAKVISSRKLYAQPVDEDTRHKSLTIIDHSTDQVVTPTHWSFGQLCSRVQAPAGYLRSLPAPMAADCLNYGLMRKGSEEVGVLTQHGPMLDPQLMAATGPQYGRIWNHEIIDALVHRFGDGVSGQFTVPGEFGRRVTVTKDNTTLFASDRDMFVFLADETHRFDIKGRRDGQTGEMSRGFFVWNSQVGSSTFGIATFLFDYVCSNRIVWGADGYQEFKIRHTANAPDRWIEEVAPAIEAYANKSTAGIEHAISLARTNRFDDGDHVREFLAKRFTKGQAEGIMAAHIADEDRPIESLWDATVGATAYARGIQHQDARVDIERKAGKILSAAL